MKLSICDKNTKQKLDSIEIIDEDSGITISNPDINTFIKLLEDG